MRFDQFAPQVRVMKAADKIKVLQREHENTSAEIVTLAMRLTEIEVAIIQLSKEGA